MKVSCIERNKMIISELLDCVCCHSVQGGMNWVNLARGSWFKEAVRPVKEGGDESLPAKFGSSDQERRYY